MNRYQVSVGNVGIVYDGNNWDEAMIEYRDFCLLSKMGRGRCSGEPVVLIFDGEIVEEYLPLD